MQITRNKLLITLILVAATMLALSSTASALVRVGGILEPLPGPISKDGIGIDGEPERPDGSLPPPTPVIKSAASRPREGTPSPTVRTYMIWIGRIWAARWRITF